jgi:hypothetical protein
MVILSNANGVLKYRFYRYNLRIWRSNNPNEDIEHKRDSSKLNVFCTSSKQNVFGPLFFAERTATGIVHPDMSEEFFVPVLKEEGTGDMLFQQDGAPLTDFLNHKFPEKWNSRGRPSIWPPRWPDFTPLDFCF